MVTTHNPILVALDVASAEEAVRLAKDLAPHVGGFKVGLQLLSGPGPATISAVADLGKPVFADAKLHDIPNTVAAGCTALAAWGARWITVHGAGGTAMIEAAVEAVGPSTGILVVTVLTSLDAAALAATGVTGSVGRQVARLTRLAERTGAEGVVCGVRELGDVAQVAPELTRVTPGIRPTGVPGHDQARVASPAEAIRRGATYLVVGRAITGTADPIAAAVEIADSLD